MSSRVETIRKIAASNTPVVDTETIGGTYRHNVIDSLVGNNNVGIELGVAAGTFSARMVSSDRFSLFFGVDIYADMHDINQYKEALTAVGLLKPYKLLRMTFDDAVDLFDDDFFDFIYVDGYAHTGEEGGSTLIKWYKKLKVGGVMAGDDYHEDWPLVKWAVNDFASRLGVKLKITERSEDIPYCAYPSWFFIKEKAVDVDEFLNHSLFAIGKAERDRIAVLRTTNKRMSLRRRLVGTLDAIGIGRHLRRAIRR